MLGPRQEVALQQNPAVAWTSTPAKSVSSGVATTSRVRAPWSQRTPACWRTSASSCDLPARRQRTRMGTRALRTAVPHQQVLLPSRATARSAVASETISEARFTLATLIADGRRQWPSRRPRRERRINVAVVLDEHGHAPKDAVRIGSGVEEPGDTGRPRQAFEIAHAPVAVKNGAPSDSSGGCTMARPTGCCTHVLAMWWEPSKVMA